MATNKLPDKMQSDINNIIPQNTDLMKVQHDIVRDLDSGRSVMLVLLYTNAAFVMINIEQLLSTLVSRFNVGSTALDWFRSYLTGRSQLVLIGSFSSNAIPIYHGEPQSSVLGPVMCNAHTTPIAGICKKHQMLYHRFADDIQLYANYNLLRPTTICA